MRGDPWPPDLLVVRDELVDSVRVVRYLAAQVGLPLGDRARGEQRLAARGVQQRPADVRLRGQAGELLAADLCDVYEMVARLDSKEHGGTRFPLKGGQVAVGHHAGPDVARSRA